MESLTGPIVSQWYGIYDGNFAERLEAVTNHPEVFLDTDIMNVAFGKIIKMGDGSFSINYDGPPEVVGANVTQLMGRAKRVNPNIEFYLTVGGDGGPESYGGAVRDPNFGENVGQFLQENGFKGFDNDWESGIDPDVMLKVSQNIYNGIHRRGMGSTICTWPGNDNKTYNPALEGCVDRFNMMTYGAGFDARTSVKSFSDSGFSPGNLVVSIETEKDYSVTKGIGGALEGDVDTIGPGGSISDKASVVLNERLAGGCTWNTNNDYVGDDGLPTCAGGLYYNQILSRQAPPNEIVEICRTEEESRRLHALALQRFQGHYTRYQAR